MTTLAYRDGVLAADSRVTLGDYVCTDSATKVRRLADGSLVGFVGVMGQTGPFLDWLASSLAPEARPELKDTAVIIVSPDGLIREYEGTGYFDVAVEPFHAWGGGGALARAAMHMGASAERAVEIACLVDPSSGGRVQSVRLDSAEAPGRFEPRRYEPDYLFNPTPMKQSVIAPAWRGP